MLVHLNLGDFPCYKFIADFHSGLLPEPGRTQNVVIFPDIKRSFLYVFVKPETLYFFDMKLPRNVKKAGVS